MYRKSEARKGIKYKGWELIFSYSLERMETIGIVKGVKPNGFAKAVNITAFIENDRACARDVGHPLLLLALFVAQVDSSEGEELRHRHCREVLKKLERAVTLAMRLCTRLTTSSQMARHTINTDIIECSAKLTWNPVS